MVTQQQRHSDMDIIKFKTKMNRDIAKVEQVCNDSVMRAVNGFENMFERS